MQSKLYICTGYLFRINSKILSKWLKYHKMLQILTCFSFFKNNFQYSKTRWNQIILKNLKFTNNCNWKISQIMLCLQEELRDMEKIWFRSEKRPSFFGKEFWIFPKHGNFEMYLMVFFRLDRLFDWMFDKYCTYDYAQLLHYYFKYLNHMAIAYLAFIFLKELFLWNSN